MTVAGRDSLGGVVQVEVLVCKEAIDVIFESGVVEGDSIEGSLCMKVFYDFVEVLDFGFFNQVDIQIPTDDLVAWLRLLNEVIDVGPKGFFHFRFMWGSID